MCLMFPYLIFVFRSLSKTFFSQEEIPCLVSTTEKTESCFVFLCAVQGHSALK